MAKAKAKTRTKAKGKKKSAAAKVRCAGKTKDGKRCKRMVTKPAKYCHLHKKR
jgi:hypothetical protein